MDDYTLQQELEALAGNAFNPDMQEEKDSKPEPISTTITRWQTLFNLSHSEAIDRIMSHRNNLTRPRISDVHWDILKQEKEAEGYDREAYEYELDLQKKKATLPDTVPGADSTITYLIEIGGMLDSKEKVQVAAGMDMTPVVVRGRSNEDGREVELCCVDGLGKVNVLSWAAGEGGGFEPTILVDPRSLQ